MTKALGRAIIFCALRSVGDESKGFLASGQGLDHTCIGPGRIELNTLGHNNNSLPAQIPTYDVHCFKNTDM